MDPLRFAYSALALGLMGFGLVWGWLGLRGDGRPPPLGARVVAVLCLVLAAGGTVAAVVLEGRAARPW